MRPYSLWLLWSLADKQVESRRITVAILRKRLSIDFLLGDWYSNSCSFPFGSARLMSPMETLQIWSVAVLFFLKYYWDRFAIAPTKWMSPENIRWTKNLCSINNMCLLQALDQDGRFGERVWMGWKPRVTTMRIRCTAIGQHAGACLWAFFASDSWK